MRKILNRVSKTDWFIIGLYYSFVIPMVFVTNGLTGIYDMWSWEGLIWMKDYFLDFGLDTIVLILVVFWIFPDFFQKRKYFVTFYLVIGLLLLQRIIQPWLFPKMYKYLDQDVIIRLLGGIENNFDSIIGLCLFLIAKQHYESKNKVMQLEKEKKESELQLLRAQIDPHFLFNNLNILDILINIDPKKASHYTKRLSSLYRYMIRHKDQDVVSVAEEWQFSKDYIYLLQQRFDELYVFENELEGKELDTFFIPPASMQTLLENIVKHNLALPNEPIHASIFLEEDYLCVQNDNRPKESVKDSTGTGLNNLKKRIQFLTDQTLLIETTATQFIVKVPLVKLV